jgi:hypothetical protein
MKTLLRVAIVMIVVVFAVAVAHADEGEWIQLFNGKNLDGWKVKFTGFDLDDNYNDTFRVEDGVMKVAYDKWDNFGGKFGHIFCDKPFSNYILRIEYRFVGDQCPGGPGWAFRNSGIMIHGQSPESMRKDQDFPVSIEVQLLGGGGSGKRPTGNVCTPGTNLEIDGELVTQHIVKSSAPTFPADEWVQIEIEVRGNEEVIHRVNGEEVLRYQRPQLDPEGRVESAEALLKAGVPVPLSFGYIALQAEGQPVWFRNIELQALDK